MALEQVGALVEGLLYQGMFFWLQAAPLLDPESKVAKVTIEHDLAAGVDDVAVFYTEPGVDAGGQTCSADYFQVKYHVDRRDTYTSTNICDPELIGNKQSLLQQFLHAHQKLKSQPGWYRLHLISNWDWDRDDPLGAAAREGNSGALPRQFFTDSPRTKLGKIREMWRSHLNLPTDEFIDFARRIRLGTNYFGRRGLREWMGDKLARYGLKGIPPSQTHCSYDSLILRLIADRRNEFDAVSFQEMCLKEGLMDGKPTRIPVIGIRSFLRCAERIEEECLRWICVARHFDGRHVIITALWESAIKKEIRNFLASPFPRRDEHLLLLDCHCSIAFLAGYEWDRKSGVQVFPFQKGARPLAWKPTGIANTDEGGGWEVEQELGHPGGLDRALAVSISQDCLDDVRNFISGLPQIGQLLSVKPKGGVGASSLRSADHALAMADSLAKLIRASRPREGGVLHLFMAVPNGFAYFLGQHRSALGALQLYEFDFEGGRDGSYSPSFHFPD